jgi:succinoglycan biosynthesis transport protein ExoP
MNMNFEIRKYLGLVKRWWWLLVVSAVIPMAVSYYFVSQKPALYQAKATIMVGRSVLQDPDPDARLMNLSNTLAAAYAELVRQGPVMESVIERLGLGISPEQLAAQIGTGIHSGAQLLEIYVTDTNPEAAALIANALADELIRRSPASEGGDPQQQEFIRSQLEELQAKIEGIGEEVAGLTASLSELTSAAEIQDAQDRIEALEQVKSTYQAAYAGLLDSYRAESPNVLSLFEPAVVPQWPIPSKTKLIVAVAGAAGFGLALGAIFLMEYMDTSLRWEADGVQSILELPVLGAVPKVSKSKAGLSSNQLSPVAESVRAIRANIFLIRPDRPFRTLLLTSPGTLEGKGFILAHLALVLAAAGDRVIVVDADMRKPSLHETFDCPNVRGLADVLSNAKGDEEDSLSVLVQETDFDNVYLLSAGRPPKDAAALLTSPHLPALLDSLTDRGDVILIDSPPVLGPPDAAVLATLVEGTILVASVGFTKRELIQQARDRLLAQQGANLLGLTVNHAKLDSRYYRSSPGRRGKKPKWRKRKGDKPWLGLAGAAERLGISRRRVRRWCRSGRLPAARKVLGWQVERDGLERMIEDMLGGKVEVQGANQTGELEQPPEGSGCCSQGAGREA